MNKRKISLYLISIPNAIRAALKQKESNNRDGMDIAILNWHKTREEVHIAGAKNPVLLIQNNELTQLRADKMPIGGEQREMERVFTKQIISLASQTTPTYFYLFSDGYQDQFGGEENKKFMIRSLRELIFIHHKSDLPTQKQVLETTFTQWLGTENQQTDDVLLIGIKIEGSLTILVEADDFTS